MARTLRDPYTLDLFKDLDLPKVSVGFAPGAISGSGLASRVSRAVARALKDCGKDRVTIAGLMSEQLGYPVSPTTLDAYASEAKHDHNITVERLIALVEATGKTELVGFLAEEFDLRVVPAKYENVIELALIEDKQLLLETRAKTLKAKIRSAS